MASYERLPSGKWRAQVYHPSGRKINIPADPLKSVVKQKALEIEASIKRGDFVDPRDGKITVAAWYSKWLATRTVAIATSKKSASAWRAHVEPQWGTWPLGAISYMDCKAWIADLSKTPKHGDPDRMIGPDMAALAGRLLRQLLDEAVIAKMIAVNPMRLVKLPSPGKHEDRVISVDEEARLYAACDALHARALVRADESGASQPEWLEFKTFLRFLFGTGARFQEAAGLLRANVNPLKKRATLGQVLPRDTRELRRDAKTDAGTGRPVPLTDDLAAELASHLGRHKEDLVFVSAEHRKPLHYNNVRRRQWTKVLAEAKLADPQPTMHDIRHTYGTTLAEREVPAFEIASLMGHARLASTERYLHAGEARMDRARKALSPEVPEADSPRTSHGRRRRRTKKAAGDAG